MIGIKLTRHKEISDLWGQYREALNHYILKLVKDKDTADHLSHDVLLKIYSSCCSGCSIRNVRSWLFQIAYNTCMDHFKQENRTRGLEIDVADTDDEQIYKQVSDLVKPLIDLLPEKYAVPLLLSEIRNYKQKEVADQLNLSLAATKSRILRGKQMLKETIIECIHVEVDEEGRLEDFKVKADCVALQGFNFKD
jgi:RNA polymerase sigma-70 factor (ECF subfamily)